MKNKGRVGSVPKSERVIEEVKANNLPAIITFIDFKKAFDSIHRAKMIRILKAYGIPPNLLRAIDELYRNTKAKMATPDGQNNSTSLPECSKETRSHPSCSS